MCEFVNSDFENCIASQIGVYNDESMKIRIGNNKNITDISKSIKKEDAKGVSIDLYKYSSKAAKLLFDIVKDFIEIKKDLKQWSEVAFPELFKKTNVYPFDIKYGKWVEVDNNDDLALADKIFCDFNIKKKKVLICDMDGTIYIGNKPIEQALEWIKNQNDIEIFFLTNNTSKTIQSYKQKLESFGIKTDENHIISPLTPLLSYLKEKNINSVYLIANEAVKNFLSSKLPDVELDYDEQTNQAVILTYDTQINYEKLKNACNLLNKENIEYLATHTDIVCPSEKGAIPDIGSFIKLIEVTTGKIPDKTFGKPNKTLVSNILKTYTNDEICITGDRLYTDKALADNLNCDFICVLSGETTRLDVQKYSGHYPKIVLENLGCLST